ncbi:hypothetical protein PGDDIFCJ_00035 [Thermus phage YS40_Isch]|nr:hypothetical protein PGDDIFCJ_00035 [Thermus phage YS40_Isch]
MDLKVLNIKMEPSPPENFQALNSYIVDNLKNLHENVKGIFSRPLSFYDDYLSLSSSFKDISQSFEYKEVGQNSFAFKEKINIEASELNRKFLFIIFKFEPQYIKRVGVEIKVHGKKIADLSFYVENSVLRYVKVPLFVLEAPYTYGGVSIIFNETFESLSFEDFVRLFSSFVDIQITDPILQLLYSTLDPVIKGGEVEISGNLEVLSGFDPTKFNFSIMGEPEHHTKNVYRISKYIN